MYLAFKHLHITTVILSIILFSLRGIGMLLGAAWVQRRWLRITPHIIDTVLLLSAITLTVLLHQYPFIDGWLTAKVFGLIAYIILGSIALRYGATRMIRAGAWFAALITFGYIVSVARSHNPLGFFAWLG